MRLLVFAFSIAAGFASAAVHAEAIGEPGTVRGAPFSGEIHLVQSAAPAPPKPGAPFTFTLPQSQVIVKVSDASLRPAGLPAGRPNYFSLMRADPQLILSGWLEPGSRYKGINEFWAAESRSPAFAGPLAPIRVEMLKSGPWDVVAYDVPVPSGGTSAHLRAERVEAGTWIDLHLSTTSARPPATLRAELLAALGRVEVVKK